MKRWLLVVTVGVSAPLFASDMPWQFGSPVDVSGPAREGVFYHLDSGTRRHLAAGDGSLGLVWEDNRGGKPQVQFSAIPIGATQFAAPMTLSDGESAYEPVIDVLGKGAFVVAHEQDRGVWLRAVSAGRAGPALRISESGGQVALATRESLVFVAYSRREQSFRRIYLATLKLEREGWRLVNSECVDPHPPAADQLYPAVVATGAGVTVAWEDRRFGHTVLMITHTADGKAFPEPTQLNRLSVRPSGPYGKGTGVARVSLSARANNVVAAWLDKRDFLTGHDVFATLSVDGGKTFAADERVQDEFGNNVAQWHAVAAADVNENTAIAWDDDRDGNSDVWIAIRSGGGWSANVNIPGAAGSGHQTHPAMAIDASGGLHVVWLERDAEKSGNRLWYVYGRRVRDATN